VDAIGNERTRARDRAGVHLRGGRQRGSALHTLPAWVFQENTVPRKAETMLWTIIVVLFVLWALGFAIHIGGGLIHLLLIIAVILIVYNLVTGRRA
jgi:hypothetical protein